MTVSFKATTKDIRRSPSASGQIFRQIVPKTHFNAVLKTVAHAINVANKADPAKWGLRVKQNNIMLKVGFVEMFQLADGWFHILVKDDLVPKRVRSNPRITFVASPLYANAPGCGYCDMDFSTAAQIYPELRPAHEEAIRIAARSRRHTSTAKDHSPGLIIFLSHKLNERLPQPAYYRFSDSVDRIPEEIPDDQEFEEGAAIQVLVNRYERDPAARAKCIEHYGTNCAACSMSLADRYGAAVSGLIHVHHLKPLSSVGKRSSVDPVRDLRPVCPNCHAVIHTMTPPRTIEQVKKMVRQYRDRR